LVILKDHEGDPGADVNGDFDISKKCNVIEAADGAPIRATITLDAKGGRFITKTPKIQKWDRIYFKITDRKGDTFESVVHVKTRNKIRETGKGLQLKLFCPHQSSNLMTRTISKPNIRESGFDAMVDALNQINDPKNRGVKDPTIVITTPFDETTKNGIRLNQGVTNNYIFEAVKAQTAFDEILKKEGNVVESGGALEFHYARFQSLYQHPSDTDLDKVAIQVFEQGFRDDGVGGFTNVPSITIKKAGILESNPHKTLDGKQESETATNIIAVAEKNSGSWPKDFQRHQGYKDVFESARQWTVSRFYKKGALVKDLNVTYEATVDNTSSVGNQPPSSSWIIRTFVKPDTFSGATNYNIHDLVKLGGRSYKSLSSGNMGNNPETSPTFWVEVFFAPSTDYNPLGKDKAQYWVNAMGGYTQASSATNFRAAIIDANCIIKDEFHPRTWVDGVFVDSASLPSEILDGGNPFDGLKILVNGVGEGDFAGNDPNGVSRDNAVLQFRGIAGEGGDWFVFLSSQTDREVYDFRDGYSWTFNPCTGAASFVDSAGQCQVGNRDSSVWTRGAYQPTDVIEQLFNGSFELDGQFECVHPVKHDDNDVIELGNEKIMSELESDTSAVFAVFEPNSELVRGTYFAGLNFAFPWPRNSNSDPHGAVSIGEKIKLNEIDFLNMHKSLLGERFWFGDDVEDYFPIQGFAFYDYIKETLRIGGFNALEGDYKMGIWLCDKSDNEVTIEWTHGHNDVTEPHNASVAKAKVYRGLQGFATFIPAQQIEVLDIFDWRNVVRGGFFTRDSFDKNGRYISSTTPIISLFTTSSRFALSGAIKYSVDGFRGFKPLVATNVRSASKPDRNIQDKLLKVPEVISWGQLQPLVDSTQLLTTFERNAIKVDSSLRCNLKFGDPVYYEDAEAIDETTDSLPNTLKLVVDEQIYTVSKPAKGAGGFLVSRRLVNRVWPT